MPELRKDPVTGRWVIIATERGARPSDFKSAPQVISRGFCPFCEGNEDKTPPEIAAYREHGGRDTKGWRVRVVPNKFPALQIEGGLDKRGEGIYDYGEAFNAAVTAAGIKDFHFHDLRHTAATYLAQDGATEQQLRAIGGWKSNVVNRYVHLAAEDSKVALEKLAGRIDGE